MLLRMLNQLDDGGGTGGDPGVETGAEANPSVDTGAPDTTGTEPPAVPSLDWNTVIPEEFRERPSIKSILETEDPGTELFKRFVGLEKKLGERTPTPPGADATEEDWNKFYELTRAESADAYEIPDVDLGEDLKEIADLMNTSRSPEYLQATKESFHKHGLTKQQAQGLIKDQEVAQARELERHMAEQRAAQAQLNEDFEVVAKKTFGGDKNKAIDYGSKFLSEHVTDRAADILKKLMTQETISSNDALVLFAEAGQSVARKYDSPDKFMTDNTVSAAPSTAEGLKTEIARLMAEPEYFNKNLNPAKTTELWAKVQSLQNKQLRMQGIDPNKPYVG